MKYWILLAALGAHPAWAETTSEACRRAGTDSSMQFMRFFFDEKADVIERGSADEIVQTVEEFYTSETVRSAVPWILLNSGERRHVEAAWQIQKNLAFQNSGAISSLEEELELLLLDPPKTYTAENVEKTRDLVAQIRKSPPTYNEKRMNSLAHACLYYGGRDCRKAVREIVRISSPRTYQAWAIMFLDELEVLLSSPVILQAAARLSLKILRGGKLNNFYWDLRVAFMESGATTVETHRLLWAIVAFYASRGPSIHDFSQLTHDENAMLIPALQIIFAAMPKIDFERTQIAGTYSFPAFVQSQCVYGSGYHFWMGAYLARHLKAKGYSADTALVAVHIMGTAYEFVSPSISSLNFKNAFLEGKNGAATLSTRKDIILNDAGALWVYRHWWFINVNAALERMHARSWNNPRWFRNLVARQNGTSGMQHPWWYPFWKAVIAPDAFLGEWRRALRR